MFCPQCGSTQPDELRFCKSCGANLEAVRTAVAKPGGSSEKFDWNKTWVAEMLQGSEEAVRRAAELERLQGGPEAKRRKEIKEGIITASVGLSSMIVLFVIMNGVILSGRVSDAAIEILARVWIAGLIPTFVGLAMVFNGMFVSKKGELPQPSRSPGSGDTPSELKMPETNQMHAGTPFSVVDQTTRHLEEVPRKRTTTEFPDRR